jgi:hypothetical protein
VDGLQEKTLMMILRPAYSVFTIMAGTGWRIKNKGEKHGTAITN